MKDPQQEGEAPKLPRYQLSCTACFDALWFCYSPVHQMQQYYRHGVPNNCYDKWSALFDCLNLKTKKSSELQDILEARERSKTHIWSFRSIEEVSAQGKELFGHINDTE